MNPRTLATRTPTTVGIPIVSASHVNKAFTTPDGEPLRVLEDISLELNDGEIVALLGKSGCGKRTPSFRPVVVSHRSVWSLESLTARVVPPGANATDCTPPRPGLGSVRVAVSVRVVVSHR